MDAEEYKALALVATTAIANIDQFNPYIVDMGLIGTHVLSDKEFIKLGLAIRAIKRRVSWLWVDYLASAYGRWGENAPQIINLFGEFAPKTINDYINMGKRDFPLAARKWKLSVSHYREVRSLPYAAQALLLGLAETHKWGASITLRAEVQKLRSVANASPNVQETQEDSGGDTETPEETNTPQKSSVLTQSGVSIMSDGDKNKIANLLAGLAQQMEKLDYAYYSLHVEIIKTGDFVLDNDSD